jgi:aldehyde dehydrogenase (NAD+)
MNLMNSLRNRYGLFIDGQFVEPSDGEYMDTYNPANGKKLAEFAAASKADVDKAVKAAWKAFPAWRDLGRAMRAAILNQIADVIDENRDFLARVETMDNGKPIRETSTIDVPYAAEHFRYFASAVLTHKDKASVLDGNLLSIELKEPIGVVGQIVPWNFPFLMGAWKIAPVLAAGDTTVIKPSSTTPLSLLVLMDLIQEIVPAGVINVINGRGSKTGQYLLDHPDLRKLAFTGSTEVGYSVAEAAAKKLIPSTLELGGKSANIFFNDADLEQAVDGAQLGILFNQGQVCCAGSRIFVQDGIYDEFVAKLTEQFRKVKQGDPLDPETQVGAQVDAKQLKKIASYMDVAREEGAVIAAGGEINTDGDLAKGNFFRPTLITNVTNDMRIAREEIFGPVAVVIRFHTEEEVIAMANDSDYGLGGGVWTRDISRAIRVARRVETGRMWVNTYNMIPAGAPFGGVKKSGYGRETDLAILDAYTTTKNIMINLSDAPSGFFPEK